MTSSVEGSRPARTSTGGRLLPYGERAVLIEVEGLDRALAVHAELLGSAPDVTGLVDLVVGARTVLVVADAARHLAGIRSAAAAALAATVPDRSAPTPAAPSPEDVVVVPVHYDGADLAEVAELTGLSLEQVVAAHTATPWRVGFAGFAPGFAYLVDGDPRLRVPRRPSPRTRVPAGAVGLAGEFSGVYPRSSPGGWQLIGRTDLPLWDLDRDPPALLRPGLWVRFTRAGVVP